MLVDAQSQSCVMRDTSGFVQSSVNVVDRNGMSEGEGVDSVFLYKFSS